MLGPSEGPRCGTESCALAASSRAALRAGAGKRPSGKELGVLGDRQLNVSPGGQQGQWQLACLKVWSAGVGQGLSPCARRW